MSWTVKSRSGIEYTIAPKTPCKCHDVNHNLTRPERRALHSLAHIARTAGDMDTVRAIQHQLKPCPIIWGRK